MAYVKFSHILDVYRLSVCYDCVSSEVYLKSSFALLVFDNWCLTWFSAPPHPGTMLS